MTMRYEQKKFGVGTSNSDEFRDNWDRIFGKAKPKPCRADGCTAPAHEDDCVLCKEHCHLEHPTN